jgi:hypothetical protein
MVKRVEDKELRIRGEGIKVKGGKAKGANIESRYEMESIF